MKRLITFIIICFVLSASAQTVIPLYSKTPNTKQTNTAEITDAGTDGVTRVSKVVEPTLTVYRPAGKPAQKCAVIICPGGGYTILAYNKEGTSIAKEFNKYGITALVLKYRLPDSTLQVNREITPLQDAEQAIKLVRSRSEEWGIDKDKIGVMGFSAGGHLASTIGTHYKNEVIDNKEKISLRPDFLVLCYPVISFSDSLGHRGSRNRLIGINPPAGKIKEYSNELQVTAETPPTFLVHAGDDKTVKVVNSILFYEALQRNGINAELHIYPHGGHGFGLVNKTTPDAWFERCINWLKSSNFIASGIE